MEKMIPKEKRSGKKSALIIGLALLSSVSGFSTASHSEQGSFQYFMLVVSSLLLAFAILEAAQWIFRSKHKQE